MAELSTNTPGQQQPEPDDSQITEDGQSATQNQLHGDTSSSTTDSSSKKQDGNRQSWIAWPHEHGLNDKRNKQAYDQLVAIVGPEKIYTSHAKDCGTAFWRVQLTDEEAQRAKKTSQFGLVHTEMVKDQKASYASGEHKETNRREWAAWPHDAGLNHALNKLAHEKLVEVAGPERIEISDTRDLGVNFWRAQFLPEEAAVGKRIKEIAILVPQFTLEETPELLDNLDAKHKEGKVYLAYPPEDGFNSSLNKQVYEQLEEIGTELYIRTITKQHSGVKFWHVQLTEQEAEMARKIPGITLQEEKVTYNY